MLFCHFGEFLLILLTKNLVLRFFVYIFSLIKNYLRFYDLCISFLLHFHWGQALCDLINIFFVCDWQSLDYFQGSVSGLCVWGPRLPSSGSWPFPPLGLEYPLITAVNTQSNLIVRFGILHMILMATFGNVDKLSDFW